MILQDDDYKTFHKRKAHSDPKEAQAKRKLLSIGFEVVHEGVEKRLSEKERKVLYKSNSLTSKIIRFKPDFLVMRMHPKFPIAYWEIKSQTRNYPNFAVEQDAWETIKLLMEAGIDVVYLGIDLNDKYYAQWMRLIIPYAMFREKGSKRGSGKPHYLLPIRYMMELDEFIAVNSISVN